MFIIGRVKMMIDYKATLQKYFAECVKFLEKRAARSRDGVASAQINDAIAIIKRIASHPERFSDYDERVNNRLFFDTLPNDVWQSGVLHKYESVLSVVKDLNTPYEYDRMRACDVLLDALKDITCKNNKNVFKDLYYSMSLPTKFAVKFKQNQK